MLYSIRSERLLMEELDYNLLFCWFVGLNADEEVWDATTFTKNRERLLEADVASNPTVDFHGEKRSNETHESKTDPEARLARKGEGKEAKLSYSRNLLVENRNGLLVDAEVFQTNGTAECDAALIMLEQIAGTPPVTVGGDKGYDTREFVNLKVRFSAACYS